MLAAGNASHTPTVALLFLNYLRDHLRRQQSTHPNPADSCSKQGHNPRSSPTHLLRRISRTFHFAPVTSPAMGSGLWLVHKFGVSPAEANSKLPRGDSVARLSTISMVSEM